MPQYGLPVRYDLTADIADEVSSEYGPQVVQGAEFSLVLSFSDVWGDDWTGYAARGQLRSDYADYTGNDVEAEITATIVDPGPVNRLVHLYISADDTEAITASGGRVDLEIYNGTTVKRILNGRWTLSREVTR